ncbi:accessory Sec system translocase SecA2 [Lactobacillus equicursoris]|uniref:accessory Sec system translocase SecA2 n=1 Tax=Lactobacillus equicursoris TaxID=420645 RepID=UPI0024327E11|nr:accessory Sec system translocase SecA2 [Lactobacillus equicursoris]MDD6386768.1 accessory Sec system translocase SecA2 [Lactobacillus equicursoris]
MAKNNNFLSGDHWDLLKIRRIFKKVNKLAPAMRKLSDEELKAKTGEFKERIVKGESLDHLLPEAYAVAREADLRVLGMFPHDNQVMGAIGLNYGNIVELKTGEGKTLVATMALYLNALPGKGAILVTTNEYLADRDGEEMSQVYNWLGLTYATGFSLDGEKLSVKQKQKIYNSDIVYSTSGALGFDYLIDNMAQDQKDKYMRPFNYCIVDEADSVLLDMAITPLVIAGLPKVKSNYIGVADEFIYFLSEDDYEFNEEHNNVWLTEAGVKKAEDFFTIDNLYDGSHTELVRSIDLALKAHYLFEKEDSYVVAPSGDVDLLDKENGRVLPGMKLQAGQHQAIEMKEQLKLSDDQQAMASITYQSLFRMFKKLSGMTGTGYSAKDEFFKIYGTKVVRIPTNRPVIRKDMPDRIYPDLPSKLLASLEEVKKLHAIGRPVLIITESITVSEIYSELLLREQIPHNVLNAKNAAKEATIVKEGGQVGAVTVATTMAGRGTDIKLGPGVAELGGLAVLGIAKMSSRRIDDQLRGRAGRQGDPGSSEFYVSLEDDVVIKHGPLWLDKYREKYRSEDLDLTEPHELKNWRIRNAIRSSQIKSDEEDYNTRKQQLSMGASDEIQREQVYDTRNQIIFSDGVNYDLEGYLKDFFTDFLKQHPHVTKKELNRFILDNLSYSFNEDLSSLDLADSQTVFKLLMRIAHEEMDKKEPYFEDETERKRFYSLAALKAIDTCWIKQVDNLQQLRQMVAMRTSAQRDPMDEYHQAALRSYQKMCKEIRRLTIRNVVMSSISINKLGEKDVYYV